MLGKIRGIEENRLFLELSDEALAAGNLSNMYVSIESPNSVCIGEIEEVKDRDAYINLLGELIEGRFVFGVIKKPSINANIRLVPTDKIPMIISCDNSDESKYLYLGKSPVYDGVDINVPVNAFFSNHFAVFGSTGSGKSCSVSRLFQNLFTKQNAIPYKSTILMFDAYGEYHPAFERLNEVVPEITFKSYTTNTNFSDTEIVKIPLWLLSTDDLALLLGVESHGQLPIIEKALKIVNIFGREEDQVIKSKNDIIARAILDILTSGKAASQIRDQVISILSYYNTKELNLETQIFQPGYTRPLKQCLLIDATGKIREMELLMNFMNSFLDDSIELALPDGTFPYTLKNLCDAMDFALISEGVLKSDKIYDESNVLKVRLHSLLNSPSAKYFDVKEYVTRDQYIRNLLTATNGRKAQIINFNINYVDDRLAKTITKIYSKMFFDYAKEMEDRGSLPFHIVLEEAHRYVQNDNDIYLLGYNIFDRITKEGRKYGVLLGLITQRPSELSETALSQCNNFLVFKMLHPKDVQYIREMVPNITEEIIKKIKILQPGTCMAFGLAFKVPTIIKFDMPNPSPASNSANIEEKWFVRRNAQ
ncbi:MAG: ATP-binding protein [Bacilli bacterium]|nr:ATP-binding protein [Bacilli bacterium]